jgi:hypothetical protein
MIFLYRKARDYNALASSMNRVTRKQTRAGTTVDKKDAMDDCCVLKESSELREALNEVNLLSKLRSPHVVRLKDYFIEQVQPMYLYIYIYIYTAQIGA